MGTRAASRIAAVAAAAAALLAPAGAAHAADPGRWVEARRSTVPLQYYQGIAVDPQRNLYFDGIHVGLYRTTPDLRETARNDDVIPPEVTLLEGYDHIGDISWDAREGGRILLPLECYYPPGTSPTFNGNTCPARNLREGVIRLGTGAIGVAQAVPTSTGRDTFAWRYYVRLDETTPIYKAMWAEVSPNGELLWTQGGAGTETGGGGRDLLAFSAADIRPENAEDPSAPTGKRIKPVRRLRGAVPCSGITGATFVAGRLYVAGQGTCPGDGDGAPFRVWSIDLATGARRLEIERRIVGESEGLATVDALGGLLHWLIQPYNTEGPPTHGIANGTILSFLPATPSQGPPPPPPEHAPRPPSVPAQERPARECLPARLRVGARGVGPVRVGDRRRRAIARIGIEPELFGRVLRWCVRGGGHTVAVLGRGDRVALVASDGRLHRDARRVGPRSSARTLARRHRRAVAVLRGVYAQRRGARVVYGVRAQRVSWVAVASRSVAARPASLRAHLRRARAR